MNGARILVVGDGYITTEMFARGFDGIAGDHQIDYLQLDMSRPFVARSESERRLHECAADPQQVIDALDGHEILVVHGAAVTDAVLDAAPLRLVCCARGGPVNVDVAAAAERGIPVTTTPGKNANAVVELTIAALVMAARGIGRAQRHLLDGGSAGETAFDGAEFFGVELAQRVLGLVGYGHVGRRVAARAAALGMVVLAHDPAVDDAAIRDGGAEPVTLDELLARAEFVSLHARVTPENENMMNGRTFARMRRGAFFVNTAREALVDEAALLAAVRAGHVRGAVLDVVRPSPGGGRNPLLDEPNVIVLPHIGGATEETIVRGVAMVEQEIVRLAAGRDLLHVR